MFAKLTVMGDRTEAGGGWPDEMIFPQSASRLFRCFEDEGKTRVDHRLPDASKYEDPIDGGTRGA